MAHRITLRARPDSSFTYSGETPLVTNRAGAITGMGDEALYVQNTRLVCRQVLTVNGDVPLPIAVSPVGGKRGAGICRGGGGTKDPRASHLP